MRSDINVTIYLYPRRWKPWSWHVNDPTVPAAFGCSKGGRTWSEDQAREKARRAVQLFEERRARQTPLLRIELWTACDGECRDEGKCSGYCGGEGLWATT